MKVEPGHGRDTPDHVECYVGCGFLDRGVRGRVQLDGGGEWERGKQTGCVAAYRGKLHGC